MIAAAPTGWPLLGRAAWERRGELAVGAFAGVVWQAAVWLAPLALAYAIDRGVVAGDTRALVAGTLALAGLALVEAATTLTRHRFACIPAARALIATRGRLHAQILTGDDRGRRDLPPGEVVARATGDAGWVEEAVDYLPSTVARAVTIVAVGAILVAIDPVLAAVVLTPLPIISVLAWRWSIGYRRRSDALQRELGESGELAESSLSGFRALAGLGAGAAVAARWRRHAGAIRARGLAVARLDAVYQPAVQAVVATSLVGALWLGGRQVIEGELGIGTLVAVVAYVLILAAPLEQMGDVVATARRAEASAARLAEVLDRPSEAPSRVEMAPPGRGPLDVHLAGVSVVASGSPPILSDVTLRVRAGEVLALVGASGSGTSSLAALMAGRLAPNAGQVSVGGVAVGQLAPAERAQSVQLVGPDEFLHAGTLGAATGFGRPNADPSALRHALARAGAEEVAGEHPDGLGREVGEQGRFLSGGQRQRVALARALLVQPRVLVLDDATAAVDPARERAILDGLADGRRTLVLVTRRAAVAARADRVALVADGRIVAQGHHRELLARADYRALVGNPEVGT